MKKIKTLFVTAFYHEGFWWWKVEEIDEQTQERVQVEFEDPRGAMDIRHPHYTSNAAVHAGMAWAYDYQAYLEEQDEQLTVVIKI